MKKELAILGLGNHLYMHTAMNFSDHEFYQQMLKRHYEAEFENITYEGRKDSIIVHADHEGRRFTLHGVHYGLSDTWDMDRVVTSPRTEAVIGVGFCGSIKPDIEADTVIIAKEAAISSVARREHNWEEKLTYSRADQELTDELEKIAKERGYEVCQGKILTVANPRCETAAFIREAKDAGFDGVEMEAAAVYQLAEAAEKPAAIILYVSDNQATHNGADIAKEVWKRIKADKHIEMTNIARDALLEVFKEGNE